MALRVARLAADNARRGSALRVANVRAASTPFGTARLRVTRLAATSPVVVPVRAGDARSNLEPLQQATLAGSGAVQGLWRQVAGPAVQLVQAGTAASYSTPLTLYGAYLEFEYVVQGQAARVAHTVLAATERAVLGGVEAPLEALTSAGL